MNKIAKFHKEVDIYKDCALSDVELPKRSTPGSAGYDFYAPHDIVLAPGETKMFDTGVCAEIADGWVLNLFPRSSLGIKGIRIKNTVGIIDADFYPNSIKCCMINDSFKTITINKGERYMQGIFYPFGITVDDDPVNKERKGGIGSTGK